MRSICSPWKARKQSFNKNIQILSWSLTSTPYEHCFRFYCFNLSVCFDVENCWAFMSMFHSPTACRHRNTEIVFATFFQILKSVSQDRQELEPNFSYFVLTIGLSMIVRVSVVLNRTVECWQWLTFQQPVRWSSSESKWVASRQLMISCRIRSKSNMKQA